MTNATVTASLDEEPRLPAAGPDSPGDELARYRRWMGKIAEVCDEIAGGNLESRLLGCEEAGDIGRTVHGLNRLLDITDAFVREAKAALDYASHGKFFRRVILNGLPGTFRHAATLINEATDKMGSQAKSLAEADQRRMALADEFDRTIQAVVATVAASATEMQATAQTLVEASNTATVQAASVAAASEQTSMNVQTVAAANEEVNASASEIGRRISESTKAARGAVAEAERTNRVVVSLSAASLQIGQVVKVISEVAKQTNLLALNATIEAARVGELGKGFAVVASEVKGLSRQTSNATDDVAAQIGNLQAAAREGVEAIERIQARIAQVDELSAGIDASVAEQRTANLEISGNIQQAALGTREVSRSILVVSEAARQTNEAASALQLAATDLSRQAEDLNRAAMHFVNAIRS